MKYITHLSQSEEDSGPNQISKTKLAQTKHCIPPGIWLGPGLPWSIYIYIYYSDTSVVNIIMMHIMTLHFSLFGYIYL